MDINTKPKTINLQEENRLSPQPWDRQRYLVHDTKALIIKDKT